ncbi:VQ motif-containing protein 22-like [Macadamia integrifolia]|uniref:VQ motif-containing protein 22-like n=1 Tax=Macadamia integrifolia TaxID=60698 RepID=UPI001C4FABBC|nr:VQ motif-containing protein 22-like [Macadamia integrifolia]
MAITDTMAGPSDWLQFYRRNLAGEEPPPSPTSPELFDPVSDAAVVTSASTPGAGNPSGSTSSVHLNPEGRRVAKPNRRRSRASRRAPTTLLNTDTTNFRAMVQQFTGVPSAPFNTAGPHHTGATNFNFVVEAGDQHHLNTATTIAAPGYHLQQQQQQPQQQFQQQQQQHQFQQQQMQYMFSRNNPTSDVFGQRFRDGNQR